MPEIRTGRWLGVYWCAIMRPAGERQDLSFGLSTRAAVRRCLTRQFARRAAERARISGIIARAVKVSVAELEAAERERKEGR